MSYDVHELRSRFPALRNSTTAYLDGPAGTQVPEFVIEAVAAGLAGAASNVGGAFEASRRSGEAVKSARRAAADLLGGRPSEIVFGANMTTITMAFSRAVLRSFGPGDRIIVTRLDHDANVTPWVLAASDAGVDVDWLDIDPDRVDLALDRLDDLIEPRTRLLALTGCSNAFGTVTDLERVMSIVGDRDVRVFVDAVHLAAHRRIDVAALGVDAVVCSAYKFYGPHVGVLWGRREWLDEIAPYKVRPASESTPGKFETGTPSFGLLAGLGAAVDHLASLGAGPDRRARLDAAFEAIAGHESSLARRFLSGLPASVRMWGPPSTEGRVSTFAFSVEGRSALEVAELLGARGIAVWSGHYYAVEPMRRLGLLESGGLVRAGFVSTTTPDEVDRLLAVLDEL